MLGRKVGRMDFEKLKKFLTFFFFLSWRVGGGGGSPPKSMLATPCVMLSAFNFWMS